MVLVIDTTIRLSSKVVHILFYLFGWQIIYRISRNIGRCIHFLDHKKRKLVEEVLLLLFGRKYSEGKTRDIVKDSFENYYMRHAESILFGVLNEHSINQIMNIEGIENLDSALSEGRGVILLLSHFGSFLLPLPFLGFHGYKINQIAGRQIFTSLLEERLWVWRKNEAEKLPVSFVQADAFLRPVYKSLKSNEIVAIAFDGRDSSRWCEVDFFGRKARFSPGPFGLARRTGAVIIPTFVIKKRMDLHKLILKAPFCLSEESNFERAVLEDVQRFTEIFARYIDKYPSHFVMILSKYKELETTGTSPAFFVES